MSFEVKHEEKWFLVSNMEISKKKLHFRETKKDPCLPFYFHVLNLFKSWSNLGFDQDSNGQKIKKSVFARRVKLGGRGITRKERRRERIMVSPLFRVMMLTFVQGLSVSRRCERASERVERGRE